MTTWEWIGLILFIVVVLLLFFAAFGGSSMSDENIEDYMKRLLTGQSKEGK